MIKDQEIRIITLTKKNESSLEDQSFDFDQLENDTDKTELKSLTDLV
jgi:hypothetical protein